MVLEKCHFDNIFKKTITVIEDTFDKDFKDGIAFDLVGIRNTELRLLLQAKNITLTELLWDKDMKLPHFSKVQFERVIYENLIILLYLYKESLEEKQ